MDGSADLRSQARGALEKAERNIISQQGGKEKDEQRGTKQGRKFVGVSKKKSWQWGKPSPSTSLWVAQIICAIRIIASMAVTVEEIQ